MQIEILNDNKICFIYIQQSVDIIKNAEEICDKIYTALNDDYHKDYNPWRVIIVPNGVPCKGSVNPMFYVCRDSGIMMNIVKKFANVKPGSIIPLTDIEMRCITNQNDFMAIPLPEGD